MDSFDDFYDDSPKENIYKKVPDPVQTTNTVNILPGCVVAEKPVTELVVSDEKRFMTIIENENSLFEPKNSKSTTEPPAEDGNLSSNSSVENTGTLTDPPLEDKKTQIDSDESEDKYYSSFVTTESSGSEATFVVEAPPKVIDWLKEKKKEEKRKAAGRKAYLEEKKKQEEEARAGKENIKLKERESFNRWLQSKKCAENIFNERKIKEETEKENLQLEKYKKAQEAFQEWLKRHPHKRKEQLALAFYRNRPIHYKGVGVISYNCKNYEPWNPCD